MALTPTIQSSQDFVFAITDGATPSIEVGQTYVLALANFPTEEVDSSQSFLTVLTADGTPSVELAQSYIVVLARGRVDDPKVRVWTYTMDGHDYYVLRLGNQETLVYDTYSQEWFTWGTGTEELWSAYHGINWKGSGALSRTYGSDVIVGHDGNGALFFLHPQAFTDDHPVDGDVTPVPFERQIDGQAVKRGYSSERVYAVELLGSIGEMDDATLTNVTLYSSDDEGHTYSDHGTVSITNADYGRRVDWRSLGSLTAPGRLFRILDDGALVRIDSLTLYNDQQE